MSSDNNSGFYEGLAKVFFGVLTFTVLGFYGAARIRTLASEGTVLQFDSILEVCLFLLTLLVGVAWYLSLRVEVALLKSEFSSYVPVPNMVVDLVLVATTALLLGLLCFAAKNILYYSSLFLVYLFVSEALWWCVGRSHIREMLRLSEGDKRISQEIRAATTSYYFGRSQKIRKTILWVLGFCALTLAVFGAPSSSTSSKLSRCLAMLIAAANIIQNEMHIWYLRLRRFHAAFLRVQRERRLKETRQNR